MPDVNAAGRLRPGLLTVVATDRVPTPNILVICGDDIGWYDVSAYDYGVMG